MSLLAKSRRVIQRLLDHPETWGQVARYAAGGAACAILNVLLVKEATERGLWYVGSVGFASVISYSLSFCLHKYWAFRDPDLSRVHEQFGMHILVGLSSIVLDMLFVYSLVEWTKLHYITSQLLAMLAIAVINFFFYRLIIFRSPKEAILEAL